MINETAVIEFLKKYGNLDNEKPPMYKAEDQNEIFHSPLAYTQTFRRNDPAFYTPPKLGDKIYSEDFTKGNINFQDVNLFESTINSIIPNSKEYVLIDLGSHLGRRLIRPFAKSHPLVRIIMVDDLTKKDIENDVNYDFENSILENTLKKRIQINEENINQSVTDLMRINGFNNIIYVNKKLTKESYNLGIDNLIKDKNVVLSGFKMPRGFGELTHLISKIYSPEKIIYTNTGLEKLGRIKGGFDILEEYSKKYFTNKEIQKIKRLFNNYSESLNSIKTKEELIFTRTLQTLYALSHKNKLEDLNYEVELKHLDYGIKPLSFNNALTGIIAKKR